MQLNEINTAVETTNECCNSGCNNCVLDIRQRELDKQQKQRKSRNSNCIDVFNGGSYATFQVKSIVPLTATVWRYCFQYRIDGRNDDAGDDGKLADDSRQDKHQQHQQQHQQQQLSYLHIPPTFYLLLRAPINAASAAVPLATATQQLLSGRERHDKNTADHFISRPYTPFVYDSEALTFDIVVKLQPHGWMTEYLRALHIGQCTEWKGCFGSFEWTANKYKYLICISHGVAIAPIHHLIGSILADDTDDTVIYSLACYQNIENILLRDEHSEFRQYWNFHSRIYLSESQCGCQPASSEAAANATVSDSAPCRDCQCIRKQQRFNENICNYRLDSQELINLYRKFNTSSICTVFCGANKLERIIKDCLQAIGDKAISENYFNLE